MPIGKQDALRDQDKQKTEIIAEPDWKKPSSNLSKWQEHRGPRGPDWSQSNLKTYLDFVDLRGIQVEIPL